MLKALFYLGLGFSALYPGFFWIVRGVLIKNTFTRFGLVLACLPAGAATLAMWAAGYPRPLVLLAAIWWVALLGILAATWRKGIVRGWMALTGGLLGTAVLAASANGFPASPLVAFPSLFLGASIFSAAAFATALGHWYLENRSLPMKYLQRANAVLAFLLIVRLAWNAGMFALGRVGTNPGVGVAEFAWSIPGIPVLVGPLFGIAFPLVLAWLVRETLRIGSNTSATGLLYVGLISLLLADVAYKFHLLRYGIAL